MRLSGRNKIKPEFSMSSMTDIVFLLLIFFMIASTLAKELNTIDVKLPKADGKTENRNTISVTINNNNEFYINSSSISKAAAVPGALSSAPLCIRPISPSDVFLVP